MEDGFKSYTGLNWWTVRRLWMNLMLWTGAAFFRVEGSISSKHIKNKSRKKFVKIIICFSVRIELTTVVL
jgi:hypothetical protein